MSPHSETSAISYDTELTAANLISRPLLSCHQEASVQQAAQLMHQHKVSCIVIVCQQQKICGIWTEADSKKLDLNNPAVLQQSIASVMSSPVISVCGTENMSTAAALMKQQRIRRLLVVDQQKKPLGMLTQSDIVRHQRIEHYLLFRDVGSSLSSKLLQLPAAMSVADAANQMRLNHVDAALIEFSNHPPALLTERDLISMLASGSTTGSLRQLADKPLLTVTKATRLLHAVELLQQHHLQHLGVTDNQGNLLGLLSHNDILLNIEYAYVNQLKDALSARDMALRASADHLRLAHKVIEASLDGIMITDARGIIQSVNPSFTTLTGYSAIEAIGQTPKMLSSGKHDLQFYQRLWFTLKEQGSWQGEIWNRRKNGDIYPEWLSISAIKAPDGQTVQYAAIFSDMTDRKSKEKQIHNLAYFDELTGLANRRLFFDRLHLALANAKRHQHQLVILFLDLDLFKRINDTLGHQAGDVALKEVARRLLQTLRAGESAARIGGDEFTILVPECEDLSDAEHLAKRLVKQFTQPVLINGHELFLTTSIGISVFPHHGDDAEQLLKHADAAMYLAKESGRNQYAFYSNSLGLQYHRELQLEQALRLAIRQQQLQVYYQPKINLHDGRLHSAEALLRWHDGERGSISPASFIPLAEKLGLIGQIGDWVLQHVCHQLAAWGDLAVPVAVNISALQLADQQFLPRLRQLIKSSGIRPSLLELELTESCLIPEQADYTLRLLQDLRELGVSLSIDDFGTGYSSLSYLRHLPINSLKIDRSFIRSLPQDTSDGQITRAIIAMAQALGLDVIAEGIEHPAQYQFLLQAGCTQGQGYLFSPAIPAADFHSWLQNPAWQLMHETAATEQKKH